MQLWPDLTGDVVEPADSPSLLPIFITSPTNTDPIGLSALRISLRDLEPGYNLVRAIMINVRHIAHNSYVAGFEEANINASGESLSEALINLKAVLVDMYDLLSSVNHR